MRADQDVLSPVTRVLGTPAPGEPTDTRRGEVAAAVLTGALVVGEACDLLLRTLPWGSNLPLVVALLVLVLAVLARRSGRRIGRPARALAAVALFFAAAYAWRDSSALGALNFFALIVALALLSLQLLAGDEWSITRAPVRDYACGILAAGAGSLLGSIMLLAVDVRIPRAERGGHVRRSAAVARGILLTVPPLLVFAGLFMKADPIFDFYVRHALRIDFEALFQHLFFTLFFTWVAGGFLWVTYLSRRKAAADARALGTSLGIVEIGIVLGALDVLFLAFVAVQLRYFFGGAPLVEATAGLTYAGYARKGFFELVFVAALTLPVLLLSHGLLRRAHPRDERIFRGLSLLLLTLLAAVMVSALERMRLYQHAYGLTEDRLYATVFMCWLGLVLVWLAVTVLRGRGTRFAFGTLVSGWLTLAVLDAVNPDAFIVRWNERRASAGHSFDTAYLSSLGADAVPAVLAALGTVPSAGERCAAFARLYARRGADSRRDWRSWNLGRERARESLESYRRGAGAGCPIGDPTSRADEMASPVAWWGSEPAAPSGAVAASAEDTKAIDEVVVAFYRSLSYEEHGEPDWDRFGSLFAPDAAVATPRVGDERRPGYGEHSPKRLIGRIRAQMARARAPAEGLTFRETGRATEHLGHAVHVRSDYEARCAGVSAPPFATGTNSLHLVKADGVWRILSVIWHAERPTAGAEPRRPRR